MPLSAVIQLEAIEDAQLDQFTGRGVHGFWFKHWKQVDSAFADELHAATQDSLFTLSPLMGLPRPGRGGVISIRAGHKVWFRFAALTESLADAAQSRWLPGVEIGSQVEVPERRSNGEGTVPGVMWKVTGIAQAGAEHPFASREAYEDLSRRHLMNPNPPRQWRLEFLTPTTFHGKAAHLPFPLPESLIGSWIRRWQAFAPLALPDEELAQWARSNLAVSSYRLSTLPAREGDRLRVGCVGTLTLRALDMPPYLRAAVDLLVHYAFYCGSGAHTAQGLGQTQLISRQ
jgi:CRISPR-associated endoribonuclease Cas6